MFPEPQACAAEQWVLIMATVHTHALPESEFIITIIVTLMLKQNKMKNPAVTQKSQIPTSLNMTGSL